MRTEVTDKKNPTGQPIAGFRLKLGVFLFGLSILLPIVGVPLVAMFIESTATSATFTGGLLLAAEIMGLVSIGVMGKSGYAFIKSRMQALLKQFGPPNKVGPVRYKIGLTMFSLPICSAGFRFTRPDGSRALKAIRFSMPLAPTS